MRCNSIYILLINVNWMTFIIQFSLINKRDDTLSNLLFFLKYMSDEIPSSIYQWFLNIDHYQMQKLTI